MSIVYAATSCSPAFSSNPPISNGCTPGASCTTSWSGGSCEGKLNGYCDAGNWCTCICETPSAVCGNGGDPETGEECDDGNTNNYDGCSSDCKNEVKICGYIRDEDGVGVSGTSVTVLRGNGDTWNLTTDSSGFFTMYNRKNIYYAVRPQDAPSGYLDEFASSELGWTWDETEAHDTPLGSSSYENQLLNSGRSCADKNPSGDDCRCSFTIQAPYCGDGIVNNDEQCDDENNDSSDGCDECRYVCNLDDDGWEHSSECSGDYENLNNDSEVEKLVDACSIPPEAEKCERTCDPGYWYNDWNTDEPYCVLCGPPTGIGFSFYEDLPFGEDFIITTRTDEMNNGNVCSEGPDNDFVYLWVGEDDPNPDTRQILSGPYGTQRDLYHFDYQDPVSGVGYMDFESPAGLWETMSSEANLQYGDDFYLCTRTCNNDPTSEFGENVVCSEEVCMYSSVENKAWFSVNGGLVGTEGTKVEDTIPDEKSFFPSIDGKPSGILTSNFILFGNDLEDGIADEGDNYFHYENSVVRDVQYGYDYWVSKFGGWENITNIGFSAKINKIEDNGTASGYDWDGGTYSAARVVVVADDLNINDDVEMNSNSGLMMIVRGNITIAGNVNRVEGFYIADGKIIIENGDPITLKGGFISYYDGGGEGIELNRDPGGDDNQNPAEYFVYGEDIIKALSTIDELNIFKYTWREANPENND